MDLSELLNQIVEALQLPVSYLTNPGKRIYVLYLASSTLLAYYVWHQTKIQHSFFKYIFNKKVWTSDSALIDYSFIFFNGFIKIFLIAPYLILGLTMAYYIDEYLTSYFGIVKLDIEPYSILLIYTFVLTILNDFGSFIVHYAMHKIPFMWEFHKIHHSATVLNPVTQYRLHPIELIINNAKNMIVFGVTTGFFDFISEHQINKVYFLGANAFSFLFLFWGANLRHSHVKLKYFPFLEYIFISPIQHQIHHSDNPKHFDKNMGAKLAIWDWLFGTLVRSKEVKQLKFGLGKEDNINYDTFTKNLWMPFKNIFTKTGK